MSSSCRRISSSAFPATDLCAILYSGLSSDHLALCFLPSLSSSVSLRWCTLSVCPLSSSSVSKFCVGFHLTHLCTEGGVTPVVSIFTFMLSMVDTACVHTCVIQRVDASTSSLRKFRNSASFWNVLLQFPTLSV